MKLTLSSCCFRTVVGHDSYIPSSVLEAVCLCYAKDDVDQLLKKLVIKVGPVESAATSESVSSSRPPNKSTLAIERISTAGHDAASATQDDDDDFVVYGDTPEGTSSLYARTKPTPVTVVKADACNESGDSDWCLEEDEDEDFEAQDKTFTECQRAMQKGNFSESQALLLKLSMPPAFFESTLRKLVLDHPKGYEDLVDEALVAGPNWHPSTITVFVSTAIDKEEYGDLELFSNQSNYASTDDHLCICTLINASVRIPARVLDSCLRGLGQFQKSRNLQGSDAMGLCMTLRLIVNIAMRNKQRDPTMNRINVSVDQETGVISVWYNGRGIPVVMDSTVKQFLPSMIFARQCFNYGEHDKVYSPFINELVVETADSSTGKKFNQVIRSNIDYDEPEIGPHPGTDYTCATFSVDLQNEASLDDDTVARLTECVHDIAACSSMYPGAPLRVFLNCNELPTTSTQEDDADSSDDDSIGSIVYPFRTDNKEATSTSNGEDRPKDETLGGILVAKEGDQMFILCPETQDNPDDTLGGILWPELRRGCSGLGVLQL